MTECETPLGYNKINDDEQQLIKLCLKKPKKWNWELTTSKSSSNIAIPTIQLYDEDNVTLLAETNESDFIAGSKLRKSASVTKAASASSSFAYAKRKTDVALKSNRSMKKSPITTMETFENDAKSVDSKKKRDPNLHDNTSNVDIKRQLKIYSRSSSCRSRSSILKRIREFSELNHDSSSSSADEHDEEKTKKSSKRNNSKDTSNESLMKKYSLRTCNIGTILVPKESFSKVSNSRRRRRSFGSLPADNVTALNNSGSNSSSLPHSPRIVDVQDISKISIEAQKYLNDVKAQSPSSDEVFLLLVKRLASLHCNNNNNLHDNLKSSASVSHQKAKNINSNTNFHYRERDKTSDVKSIEHDKEKKLVDTTKTTISSEDLYINDTISKSTHISEEQQKIMGSNVSSGKALSGRRTQSQSNIDNKSSSITNGICCSTKYSKSKRKNSNLSQQDFDKKPFNNNNNNNSEHFDGIGQIIAANSAQTHVAAATTKPKKSNQGKGKEKDRKKLHGSLPNHLDTDVDYEGSVDEDDTTSSSIYQYPPNQIYQPPNYDNAQMSAIRKFDEIYQQQHRYQAEQHFVHQQNLSFRVANTYIRQNFLRSHETNSFRIPQAYGNRVKFDPINKIVTPNSPTQQNQHHHHHHHHHQHQQQPQQPIDQCYDQGYASERSPEDEVLPPLPQITNAEQYDSMIINSMPQGLLLPSTNQIFDLDYHQQQQKFQQQQSIHPTYDFITEDCTFNVEIVKGFGGLGLSVAGGVDSSDAYPGLIRIKRLFPHQAAWMTGQLQTGDILLEANGIILTGLTNNEALEVLRTMANAVNLLVCRPHDENFRKLSTTNIEVPVPPLRSSFNFKHQQYMNQLEMMPPGEFEITLVKQQGSLGFTLQKEDESIAGHYVRALVREPATSDGRIRAGDKIIAVNDIPISNMTHEQAVIFLRQAPETVKLRLFRGDMISPTDSNYKTHHDISGSNTMKRSKLRPEAMSLISDLAIKKSTQSSSDGNSDNSSFQSSTNTMSSPRRLRKNNVKCSITSASLDSASGSGSSTITSDAIVNSDSSSNISTTMTTNQMAQYENGGTSSGTHTPFSDSSADTLTIVSQRIKYYDPHELPADDDTNDGFYDSDELESLDHDNEYGDEDEDNNAARTKRPEFLNLQSGQTDSGLTPQAARKPMYRFSIATANAYELNNLDAVLDAPTSYRMGGGDDLMDNIVNDVIDGNEHSFTSLPCETLLLACKTENDLKKSPLNDTDTCLYVTKFGKNQPLYQSAQVQINHKQQSQYHHQQQQLSLQQDDINGEKNLLKWKGVTMMPSQNEVDDNDDDDKCSMISTSEQSMPMTSLRVSVRNAQKDIHLDEMGIDSNMYKIITIEMNRRWSCRLGIRLENQSAPLSSADVEGKSITVIKEICKDTLAEKDGRLRAGDRVLMINDEIVDSRSTQEIIDMMRLISGPLCITIARKNDS